MSDDPAWITDYSWLLLYETREYYSRESFMLGFNFTSDHLYGLPERKIRSLLSNTYEEGEPYRIMSIDKFPSEEWNP